MRKFLAFVLIAAFVVTFGSLGKAAAAETGVSDPTVRLINGSTSVSSDRAEYLSGGAVRLRLVASNGYGTRANFSELGESGLLDVKRFSTKFSLNVPLGISTVFSLQTDPSGTIGAGSGNGFQVMLRKDTEGKLTLALYDQSAAKSYYATADAITLNAASEISISFDYAAGTVTVSSGDSAVTVSDLAGAFDDHYAEHNYRGYYSLSGYYMVPVTSADCVYEILEINGQTPLAHESALISDALGALETGVAGLDENASSSEISEVIAKNVFEEGIWGDLLSAVDGDGALAARLDAALADLDVFRARVDYERIADSLDVFADKLARYDAANAISVKDARDAYAAVDLEAVTAMGEPYGPMLRAKLETVRASERFPAFIRGEAERFLAGYEQQVSGSDASSLKIYRDLLELPALWSAFAAENGLDACLSAEESAALAARAEALKKIGERSFYGTLWTEGDTWDAELRAQGLYATGEGKYGETLGFNRKLELGKTSEITFNVIYALKRLGANHLHIGFYPKTHTGTLGDTDGVRVDFWFAGSQVEIKPVNGRTEQPLYDAAYITVADTGFFDPEEADYDAGKYAVKLGRDGNTLVLTVNDSEMELSGISADAFAGGVYVTVSAMSVKGADWNEVLITGLGDLSYIDYTYDPDEEDGPDNDPEENKGCAGCGSLSGGFFTGGGLGMIALVLCACVLLACGRKTQKGRI